MSVRANLDWRTLPLIGTSLIEASAGTGKTYNIALLYLRLVLERKLNARQIVVATFTDAAAQELRARIRLRLIDAEREVSLALGANVAPTTISELLADCCAADSTDQVLARLRLALAEIDLAPISTIHSFCRRILAEFPFDTGVPFTLGEFVDEKAVIRECVEDFWRMRFLRETLDPLELAFVVPGGVGGLARRVTLLLEVPEDACQFGDASLLRDWWQTLCDSQIDALQRLVDHAASFARSNSALRTQLTKLLKCAQLGDPSKLDWGRLAAALDSEKLRDYGNSRLTTPLDQHPLLQPWSAISVSLRRADQLIASDVARLGAQFVRQALATRLQMRGQTTFTQLIFEVHQRLSGPFGASLAERLGQAWPVALIDEFQDTDARQWSIFQRIHQAESTQSALILIGDPKQSIYAFRGGDIHAYLAARDSVPLDRQFSIRDNYRSHPALINALNGVYGLAGTLSFGEAQIDYVSVTPGEPGKWSKRSQALRLRLLQSDNPSVGVRDSIVLDACANDIVGLLADPNAAVSPGDIAVLLDSNPRIRALREKLIERGVPVVGAGRASVLDSPWCLDVQLLLFALLQVNDDYAVRGALATRLLGATARDLAQWAADPHAWDAQLERFSQWRRLWERRGVLAVLETVIAEHAQRLLAAAHGERALTDLRHLGELLQDAASHCYGPEELYAWLIAERDVGSSGEEASREQQLRIESEMGRVQLLTIHASKGLQYPVVFVPMAWRPRSDARFDVRADVARYHDDQHRLYLDLASDQFDAHKLIDRIEDLQERLRALYVALTRAEQQCVVYGFESTAALPSIGNPQRGALDVLLGGALAGAGPDSSWDALAAAVPALCIDRSPSAAQRYQPAALAPLQRLARAPLPAPRPRIGLYSFTALLRFGPGSVEVARGAEDELDQAPEALPERLASDGLHPHLLALELLKGPRFGDAMHGLLEAGRALPEVPKAARARYALQAQRIALALDQQSVSLEKGKEAAQLAAVGDLLDRTLDSELAPGLRLATLAANQTRPEFEFAFALHQARWSQLHELLAAHGLGDWWPANDQERILRGLMKGFIDLVFAWDGRYHVLDYKTNWLGEGRLSDYAPASLQLAMQAHHYGIQALIYTVALHRYLGQRLPDYEATRHLGESWYLFVRALGLAPAAGVWRKAFPISLIQQLDRLFDDHQ